VGHAEVLQRQVVLHARVVPVQNWVLVDTHDLLASHVGLLLAEGWVSDGEILDLLLPEFLDIF
jgi:hypothetical protein